MATATARSFSVVGVIRLYQRIWTPRFGGGGSELRFQVIGRGLPSGASRNNSEYLTCSPSRS